MIEEVKNIKRQLRELRAKGRWKCPHCKAEGWGGYQPHDTPYGTACRQSGQLNETEIRKKVAEQIRKNCP